MNTNMSMNLFKLWLQQQIITEENLNTPIISAKIIRLFYQFMII